MNYIKTIFHYIALASALFGPIAFANNNEVSIICVRNLQPSDALKFNCRFQYSIYAANNYQCFIRFATGRDVLLVPSTDPRVRLGYNALPGGSYTYPDWPTPQRMALLFYNAGPGFGQIDIYTLNSPGRSVEELGYALKTQPALVENNSNDIDDIIQRDMPDQLANCILYNTTNNY